MKTLGIHSNTISDSSINNLLSIKKLDNIFHEVVPTQYPFSEFGQFSSSIDSIDMEGIIGPKIYNGKILIFRLNRKEVINQKPFYIEKNKILDLLRIQKETIIVDEKVQEVLKLSQLQYDENGLNLYYVMTKSTPNDEINKAIYENSPFDLASYKFNGELKKLNSHEFQKFRDNSILKSKIDNTSAIKKNIRDFIIEKFVSNEAKEIGLDKTIKFILEQKSYRYGLIKSLYETKEIIYSKELTEEELTNFYAQNINNYVGPKEVIISLFYFDEFEKAQLARSEIIMASRTGRNVQFGDKDFLPGLKKYIYKDTIDRISKNLNSEFIEQVFKMQKNIVSRPILVNGEYVLVLKLDEIGAQYKPFKAVSDEIRRSIIEKKRIESKNIRIKELKNKFDIEINLLDEIY